MAPRLTLRQYSIPTLHSLPHLTPYHPIFLAVLFLPTPIPQRPSSALSTGGTISPAAFQRPAQQLVVATTLTSAIHPTTLRSGAKDSVGPASSRRHTAYPCTSKGLS